MFLYKNLFFFNIFCYFNPNHAYWNQRRLFSGNLPGMFFFIKTRLVITLILSVSLSLRKNQSINTEDYNKSRIVLLPIRPTVQFIGNIIAEFVYLRNLA